VHPGRRSRRTRAGLGFSLRSSRGEGGWLLKPLLDGNKEKKAFFRERGGDVRAGKEEKLSLGRISHRGNTGGLGAGLGHRILRPTEEKQKNCLNGPDPRQSRNWGCR